MLCCFSVWARATVEVARVNLVTYVTTYNSDTCKSRYMQMYINVLLDCWHLVKCSLNDLICPYVYAEFENHISGRFENSEDLRVIN